MLKRAFVKRNTGDGGRGRIRISFEESSNVNPNDLPLAEYCSPFGGGDHVDGAGFFFVPEVGSQVWVLEEGYQGSGKWIYVGSSFYDVGGMQNAPLEARADTFPPLNRIIKTRGGNRLELDDRNTDMRGDQTYGVRLLTGDRDGLDVTKSTGIRLGFGNTGGQLLLTRKGYKLISNAGNGLYVNDQLEAIRITTKKETVWQNWFEGKIAQYAEGGIDVTTDNTWSLTANKGINIFTRGGEFSTRSNSTKMVTIGDMKVQVGSNLNVNANQYNLTGLAGSNFLLDFPVVGDGTLSGNIVMNTAAGNILFRSGIFPPIPGLPKANATTFTLNDLSFGSPTYFGRMGLGVAGHAALEGASGGIWISPTPIPSPGTAGGSGGRPLAPGAPIAPMVPVPVTQPPLSPSIPSTPVVGTGPQPAVLGGNLLFTLQKLVLNMYNLASAMTQNAATFAMSPMGPAPLNPIIIQQLTTFITESQAILNTNLGSSATPTNILSSTVYLDG
jgi:hypothetical protein